jgi:hypothetical protein
MVHTKRVISLAGGWRSPPEARVAVDLDLVRRFHEVGARFASTGELTVFKFNAAWRRNAYRSRSVQEQEHALNALTHSADAFRTAQLLDVLRSVIDDRLYRIEVDPKQDTAATENQNQWSAFKGSRPRTKSTMVANERVRFFFGEPYAGFDWHPPEQSGTLRWRWTGPSPRASIPLPVVVDRQLRLEIHVLFVLDVRDLQSTTLEIGGRELSSYLVEQGDGTWVLGAHIKPEDFDDPTDADIAIVFPRPRRPIDLGINEDRRWLGLSVGEISLVPLPL